MFVCKICLLLCSLVVALNNDMPDFTVFYRIFLHSLNNWFNSFLRVCVSMLSVELQSGSLPSKRDRIGKPKESRRSDPPIAQVIQSEVVFFMDRALGCLREGLLLFV